MSFTLKNLLRYTNRDGRSESDSDKCIRVYFRAISIYLHNKQESYDWRNAQGQSTFLSQYKNSLLKDSRILYKLLLTLMKNYIFAIIGRKWIYIIRGGQAPW